MNPIKLLAKFIGLAIGWIMIVFGVLVMVMSLIGPEFNSSEKVGAFIIAALILIMPGYVIMLLAEKIGGKDARNKGEVSATENRKEVPKE